MKSVVVLLLADVAAGDAEVAAAVAVAAVAAAAGLPELPEVAAALELPADEAVVDVEDELPQAATIAEIAGTLRPSVVSRPIS